MDVMLSFLFLFQKKQQGTQRGRRRWWSSDLLEDLTLEDVVDGTTAERTLPAEVVVDELTLGGVVGVETSELVAVEAGDVLHVSGDLVSTENPHAGNLDGGLSSEEEHAGEGELADGVSILDEATEEVAGHEVLLVVFGVLVLSVEDGVSFGVIVVPEPLASLAGVLLVGVGALPLVEVELGRGKAEKGVRGLLGSRGILLI